jgi:hypothetical protein
MNAIPLTQLVPTLQLAIGPVILISGVGLLLLTLTNRFGRVLDRARLLSRERTLSTPDSAPVPMQIEILHRRATILRRSIILSAITVLLVPVLILVLFVSALFELKSGWLIVGIFCVSQLSLIGSMVAFIQDMNHALRAVRLEIKR